MEAAENVTSLSLDSLLGTFTSNEIKAAKSVWQATENGARAIKTPAYREIYVQGMWNRIRELFKALDETDEQVVAKFQKQGITCIKIGEQTIRISEKSQDRPEVVLTK